MTTTPGAGMAISSVTHFLASEGRGALCGAGMAVHSTKDEPKVTCDACRRRLELRKAGIDLAEDKSFYTPKD